jgi:ubiquinone/menaquinone biosynthesis C-methylase UbiE
MSQDIAARLAVKSDAIRFFDEHSDLWAGRYTDPGNGLLLHERHRTLLKFVDEWNPSPSMDFIDVGCGAGFLTYDLARRGLRGVGIDGAASMVDFCRAESERQNPESPWKYQQSDVESIPYPDNSFDVAICCGVIEYLPDDQGLLREVHRILRPGGRFLLCVTNQYSYSMSLYPLFQRMKRIPGMIQLASAIRGASTGSKKMMNLPHVPRRHKPAEIVRNLSANGFQIENDRYSGFSLLPGPFSVLFSRMEHRLTRRVNKLADTRLRKFGTFYIVGSRAV